MGTLPFNTAYFAQNLSDSDSSSSSFAGKKGKKGTNKRRSKKQGEVVDQVGVPMTKKDRLALVRKDPSRGDVLSFNHGRPKGQRQMRRGSVDHAKMSNEGFSTGLSSDAFDVLEPVQRNVSAEELIKPKQKILVKKPVAKSDSSSSDSSSSSSSKKTSSDSSSTQPDIGMIMKKPVESIKEKVVEESDSESDSESSSSDSSSDESRQPQQKKLPGQNLQARGKQALLMPESAVFQSTSTEILSSEGTSETTTTENYPKRKKVKGLRPPSSSIMESSTTDCSDFSVEGAKKKSKQRIKANNETIFE